MEVTVHQKSRIGLILGFVLLTSGCSLFPRRFPNDMLIPAPVALRPESTLEEIVQVVNENSRRVQQLQINNATLTAPRLPSLRTFIVLDRPRRFRMTAESFAGQEFDLGSNDQNYWIWIRRDERRAVYYGQHETFYQSAAVQILPVPPTWLVEAIGITQFDPSFQHDGPHRISPGRLQIRTTIPTPTGQLIRVCDIDDTRGWVLRQELYDQRNNRLLASANASEFNYYAEHGVSLPRKVDIQIPGPTPLQFTLKIDDHTINQNHINPDQMWQMPQPEGAELIDVNRLSSPPPNYVEPNHRGAMRPAGSSDSGRRHPSMARYRPESRYSSSGRSHSQHSSSQPTFDPSRERFANRNSIRRLPLLQPRY